MAITISGENNNDRILASDGVIDQLSGFNVVGVMTATSFTGDLTGDVTGNLTGNVTGNINNTTLLLQTGGTERARIDSSGRVLIGGASNSASSHADELQIINTSAEGGISIINGDSSMGHIYFGDTSGSAQGRIDYNHGGNYMRFYTANNERFRIDSSGRLLVGTTTEGHNNSDDLTIATTGHTGITLRSGTSNNGSVFFSDGTSGADEYRGWVQYTHTSNYLTFGTNAEERLRIDSSGRVFIGNTQDSSPYAWNLGLQVTGTSTNAGLSIRRDQSGSGGALLMFVKTSGAKNGNTAPSNNDQIGGIYFNAADGTDVNNVAARISGTIDGTTGSNDTPGRLTFSTTADGANSPTERLRIDSYGALLVGTTAPLYTGGDVRHEIRKDATREYTAQNMVAHSHLLIHNSNTGTDRFSSIGFRAGTGDGAIGFVYGNSANNADFVVVTDGAANGTERLRITSSGTVLKGLTTARQNYSNNTSGVEYGFQIEATSATKSSLSLIRSSNDANDGGIFIGKTRSTSVGGNTAVQAGDDLGTITFGGADGTSLLFGAEIIAEAQSGVGNDDMPTDLIFKTNGGSTNTAEKLRIASDGKIGIGNFSSITPARKVHIHEASSGAVYATFTNSTTGTSANNGFTLGIDSSEDAIFNNYSNSDIITICNGVERFRIDSSGRVGVNQSSFATSDTMFSVSETTGHCEIGIISKNDSGAVINMGDTDSYNQGRIKYDNSDNSLTFRTVGADRLRIGSTGIINAPTQAGFYARLNTNINDKTGDGTYYTVQWDTDSGSICYDQHNTFSTSTGLYTIPTGGDGVYQFSTAVCLSTDVYGRQGEAWFVIGGLRVFFDRKYFPSATGTITGFYGSCIIKMTAGQTVGVQIFVNGGSKNVDVFGAGASDHISWFSGRKIA